MRKTQDTVDALGVRRENYLDEHGNIHHIHSQDVDAIAKHAAYLREGKNADLMVESLLGKDNGQYAATLPISIIYQIMNEKKMDMSEAVEYMLKNDEYNAYRIQM